MAEAGPNVGFATLSIIPSLKGVEAAVATQLVPVEAAAAKTGTKAGSSFSSAFVGAFKSVGVGVTAFAAVGAAAVGSAIQVEDAQNIILRSTGATGKAADALKDSFENVAKTTPASFKTVATALAEVSQRTGLTGTSLETLTRQVVTFNRITKDSPVNVQDLTKAFAGFGVPASKLSASFDQLFKTSQKTGVPLETLVATVTKAGPVFRQFGISASTTGGLLAQLDKAGIESGTAIAGLRAAFNKFAKAGIAPEEGLKKTLAAIQELLKAGDEAGANKLAQSVFGGRGVGLVDAAKQGKLSLDTLAQSFSQTGDGILETAKKTSTVGGKLGILSNNLKLEGAKLGLPILEAFQKVLVVLVPLVQHFSPVILALVAAFGAMKIITGLINGVKEFTAAIKLLNLAFLTNPVFLVVVAIIALAAAIILAYNKVKPFRDAVDAVGRALKIAFIDTAAFIARNWKLLGAILLAAFIPFIGVPVLIITNWSKVVGFFKDILGFFARNWQVILGLLLAPFVGVVLIIRNNWSTIVAFFQTIVGFFAHNWQVILGLLLLPFGIGALLLIQKNWSAIVGFFVNLGEGIINAITGAFSAVVGVVSAGVDAVVGFFTALPGRIVGFISDAFSFYVSFIRLEMQVALGLVKAGIDAVIGFFAALPGRVFAFASQLFNAGIALGRSIVDGFRNGIAALVGFAGDIADGILGAFKKGWNEAAKVINDFIPNSVGAGPFHIDLPDNPIPTFKTGGIVPGPAGAPILAIVHGGEQVLTKDQQAAGGGTMNITLIGSTVSAEDVFREARWAQLTGKVKTA